MLRNAKREGENGGYPHVSRQERMSTQEEATIQEGEKPRRRQDKRAFERPEEVSQAF
jgi:hypothetical protein